jgi:hypothetical protein
MGTAKNMTTGSAQKQTATDERISGRYEGSRSARAGHMSAKAARSVDAFLDERRLGEELDRALDEQSTKFMLTLNEVERARLLILLERELHDTHVEARRTETPDYQDEVHLQEAVLARLIEKLRHL